MLFLIYCLLQEIWNTRPPKRAPRQPRNLPSCLHMAIRRLSKKCSNFRFHFDPKSDSKMTQIGPLQKLSKNGTCTCHTKMEVKTESAVRCACTCTCKSCLRNKGRDEVLVLLLTGPCCPPLGLQVLLRCQMFLGSWDLWVKQRIELNMQNEHFKTFSRVGVNKE